MLLHASDTEEVSNATEPDADIYVGVEEEEGLELMDEARLAPDWPELGHRLGYAL